MKQILIFSGTTEGRSLAEQLCANSISCTVCVATEYGALVMDKLKGLTIHQGRMTVEEMKVFITSGDFLAVVDATHPFATVVSNNIKMSMEGSKIPYLRLKRDMTILAAGQKEINYFSSCKTCAEALSEIKGNILLTTGSKDLARFCKQKELRARIYARVLPGLENISSCLDNGIVGKQIIALQGPFSVEMNEAMIRQYDIQCLVTKESGANSGFMEKLLAAHNTGIGVMIIGNPETSKGYTFEEVCEELEKLMGRGLTEPQLNIKILLDKNLSNDNKYTNKSSGKDTDNYTNKSSGKDTDNYTDKSSGTDTDNYTYKSSDKIFDPTLYKASDVISYVTFDKTSDTTSGLKISLVGMGMGNDGLITKEAELAIKEADLIFGAKRLLEGIHNSIEKVPYYLPKDIIPYLKKNVIRKNQNYPKQNVAILFSGDTGFYSGAEKLYEALQKEKEEGAIIAELKICPGISSVSYLAAKLGVSWHDGKILSIHGRTTNVLEEIKTNEKTFLLMSGVKDMKKIGSMLMEYGMDTIEMYVGYQLSYPEEEIMRLIPKECENLNKEGLYTCLIKNSGIDKKSLTHGLPDDAFIRDKVPMTKEEVREVSICKLGLHQDAILYDIGSGTGSIAVEGARLSHSIQVFAIEKKREAVLLIKQNCDRFDLRNITIIEGEAPEAILDLPVPTHAFIGGSSGNMKEILEELYEKNRSLRVVINAITLETIGEITKLLELLPVEKTEIVQLHISRAYVVNGYHLMRSENPVYIVSFNFKDNL